MCIMYYGRSCAWNGNVVGRAWEEHGDYCSIVGMEAVNFFMTCTVCTYMYICTYTASWRQYLWLRYFPFKPGRVNYSL